MDTPISVIIPTLNEEDRIVTAITSALRERSAEVIVVDGGSSDSTTSIAETLGAKVVKSAKGRAKQMNAGTAVANSEIVIFLRSDGQLPKGYGEVVRTTLNTPGVAAGAFLLRIDSRLISLRLIALATNLRAMLIGTTYGDQALFMKKTTFDQTNGFPDVPIFEGFEFVRRLRALGRIKFVRPHLVLSPRRWIRGGVLRITIKNRLTSWGYMCGVNPEKLARFHRSDISN